MDKEQFDNLIQDIKLGKYPPVSGHSVSVEQFFEIQNACAELITRIPPQAAQEKLIMITRYISLWRSKVGPDFIKESKKIENIFTKEKEPEAKSNRPKTFLKQVEDFLEEKNTRIVSIQEVDKKKVVAKTESEDGKAILFAFNKKKITEDELMKCYKQAKDSSLPYHIIILGELTKKMGDTIEAYKKLLKIEKLVGKDFACESK